MAYLDHAPFHQIDRAPVNLHADASHPRPAAIGAPPTPVLHGHKEVRTPACGHFTVTERGQLVPTGSLTDIKHINESIVGFIRLCRLTEP